MKSFFAVLFLVLMPALAWAQGSASLPTLSKQASLSVLTLGPGKDMYLAFGHSAFRVRDPANGVDMVYNYGTFSLIDDPLFIPRFVRGYLNYFLDEYPYQPYYQYDEEVENRVWVEQVLNLDQDQVNRMYRFLENNAKPENAYYLYDFIKDNCSTRIRDALTKVLGSSVSFDESEALSPHKTYRQMIDEFVSDRPLWPFLFSLVLGTASDRQVSAWEAMFLPQYLMNALSAATVGKDGTAEKLVVSTAKVHDPINLPYYGSPAWNPAFVLWPLLVLLAGFFAYELFAKRRQPLRAALYSRILDFVLFFLVGIMGVIVYYLNFLSIHTAVKGNLNIIWLLPTHLVAAFFLFRKSRPRWLGWYYAVSGLACIVPVILWPIWPQGMNPAMVALMLVVALRCAWQFILSRRMAAAGV